MLGRLGRHGLSVAAAAIAVTALAGCAAFSSYTPQAVTGLMQAMQGSDRPASEACAGIADDLPMVDVRSGSATLTASWDVSGQELARYLEASASRAGIQFDSGWRDAPDASVEACIFDGDFETMTPGPPGNDRSAERVLVIIAGGDAQLWSIAKTKDALPLDGFGGTQP